MVLPLIHRPATTAVILHHTQTRPGDTRLPDDDPDSVAAVVESIRRAHVRRGWGDIAYHSLVDSDGRAIAGRPEHACGTHAPSWNDISLAIALLGDYRASWPPAPQIDGVVRLVREVWTRYPAARLVLSHREAMIEWGRTASPRERARFRARYGHDPEQHTTCPGSGWAAEVRARLELPDTTGLAPWDGPA